MSAAAVASAGTLRIGGELEVRRLGFGAMRLPGVRDESVPASEAAELLREALRLGVNLIDTAHIYGRSEELIAAALHPYPEELVLATKGGLRRGGHPDGRPERLREDVETSLRRLRVERLDLWQLHRIDPAVPLAEQLGVIRELRDGGKIRFVGLSEVSVTELRAAQEIVPVASVQNRFNLAERDSWEVLEICEREGIAFLPWAPIRWEGAPRETAADAVVEAVAARHGATRTQVAIAWLLHHSPAIAPIPGTGSVGHLRENAGSAALELTESDVVTLENVAHLTSRP